MKNLPETVEQALKELRHRLSEICGERLVTVILYGSMARGDHGEGSDVDIAVVLRSEVIIGEEINRIGAFAPEIGLRYGFTVSVLPLTETWCQEVVNARDEIQGSLAEAKQFIGLAKLLQRYGDWLQHHEDFITPFSIVQKPCYWRKVSCSKHGSVIAAFSQNFVKASDLPAEMNRWL